MAKNNNAAAAKPVEAQQETVETTATNEGTRVQESAGTTGVENAEQQEVIETAATNEGETVQDGAETVEDEDTNWWAQLEDEDEDYADEAAELMKSQNVKEIWRCPVTGYWFTRKDYKDDQEKKTGKSLEHYKK